MCSFQFDSIQSDGGVRVFKKICTIRVASKQLVRMFSSLRAVPHIKTLEWLNETKATWLRLFTI